MTSEELINFNIEFDQKKDSPNDLTDFLKLKGIWRNTDIIPIPGEFWIPIKGFEDTYHISNYARIKALKKQAGFYFRPERILSQKITHRGYLSVTFFVNKKPYWPSVHRLMIISFKPLEQQKAEVNHINSCRMDNRIDNLEWVTRLENERHARSLGLKKHWRNEGHPMCKVSNKEVSEIRELYKSKKYNQVQLAEIYKITQATISAIILNKSRT
jgi:hypothetical protein